MTKRFPFGELVVPAAMLVFVVAYWRQAYGLSFEARLFPTALTIALLCLVAVIVFKLFRQAPSVEDADSAEASPRIFTFGRIAVVLVPGLLLSVWTVLGGIVFTAATTFAVALALGERRPLLLILLPLGMALGLHVIFSVVLHARIPHGLTAGLLG
ncbi:tripartite tricarboxylate transporter TctB family protein [Amorphus sp. 3PC139-8]|uniref:tripartite tricarboxylate transporter TctB family protein n=1 Tax=Amorphus sp. 3PC139-8 TaxID=2735676 RepID=UPI00345D81BB